MSQGWKTKIHDFSDELKFFGHKEVFYHCLLNFHGLNYEKIRTLYLSELDKKYTKLNDTELAMALKWQYERNVHRNLNYKKPLAFTEKIQWIKMFDNNIIKTRLADKYAVCEWIAEQIGERYLVPIIGVWEHFEDIDFEKLPEKFCLKTNHGSAMNLVVKDKQHIDLNKTRKLFYWWMKRPFWAGTIEKHYQFMPRKIIAERYIEEMSGGLNDYKIHCFNGKPMFIQCIGDRDLTAHTGYQQNFDIDWNPLDWIFEDYPLFPNKVECPKCLEEMVFIAEKLAKSFIYVRVDLYEIGGKILFGEMTFTPASGFYPYRGTWTPEKDLELGSKLILPL